MSAVTRHSCVLGSLAIFATCSSPPIFNSSIIIVIVPGTNVDTACIGTHLPNDIFVIRMRSVLLYIRMRSASNCFSFSSDPGMSRKLVAQGQNTMPAFLSTFLSFCIFQFTYSFELHCALGRTALLAKAHICYDPVIK